MLAARGGFFYQRQTGELPPVSGYVGLYTAASFSSTTWTDLSGNGNHATASGTLPTVVSTSGNGSSKTFNTLSGGTNSMVLWPAAILPSTYTMFHVTRYTSSTRARIFTGTNQNWLSGFWSGSTGVAYHNGWIASTNIGYNTNWFVSTDQNESYWTNGTLRGNSGAGSPSNARLSILNGQYAQNGSGEVSDWQCAEIIVYNTTLSTSNRQSVESYLRTKYGITTT